MKFYYLVIPINLMISLIFSSCGDGIKDGKQLGIIGKTDKEILADYGKPDYIMDIEVNKDVSLYEYQSSLYDLLNGTNIVVKEMMYKKSLKNKNLVIWFIEQKNNLIVIDALEWSDDINF